MIRGSWSSHTRSIVLARFARTVVYVMASIVGLQICTCYCTYLFGNCLVLPTQEWTEEQWEPMRMRRVLRKTGIPCHEAISIGDQVTDLETARKVTLLLALCHGGMERS